MGSAMSLEDQTRRQHLDDELKTMERSLHVTATSHYLSSEYYTDWDRKLQHASYLTGTFGTAGIVFFKTEMENGF